MSGPPWVMTKASSKNWRNPTEMSTAPSSSVGRNSGSVIEVSRRQDEAPSISAASLTSVGMAWSPARKMTMSVPTLRHTAIAISDGSAVEVSLSQSGPWMPTTASAEFSSPSGCRM